MAGVGGVKDPPEVTDLMARVWGARGFLQPWASRATMEWFCKGLL